jgi:hypothetical protein
MAGRFGCKDAKKIEKKAGHRYPAKIQFIACTAKSPV